MPYNIEEFIIGFVAYRSTSLEEARKLEISLVTELTNRINKNEEIRPYLREYPFPKKRLGIFISFEKKDGSYFPEENIAFVNHVRNKILYKKINPLTKKYVEFYEEDFCEAEKILKEKSLTLAESK